MDPDLSPRRGDFQLEKTLVAREHAHADAWKRKNRQALDALFDPSYIEINAVGRFSKKDVLTCLLQAVDLREYVIEKPQVLAVGDTMAVLTYRCTETIDLGKGLQVIPAHVSAVFILRDEIWKLLLWQITPLIGEAKGG